MDQTSTTSSLLCENCIRAAVRSGSYGQPAHKTLDFLRKFAAEMCNVA